MPRQTGIKPYQNFIKGWVTEASPLTFPENSCLDVDNVFIDFAGRGYRRTGLEFELNHATQSLPATLDLNTEVVHQTRWENVGGDPNLVFLVVQFGSTIKFFDMNAGNPISGKLKSFSIDLLTYANPNRTTNVAREPIEGASILGRLFLVSDSINPIYVTYTSSTDTIAVSNVNIKIRDVIGLSDGYAVNERPTELPAAHEYNLKNQGWNTAQILAYFTSRNLYPSNAQVWTAGKKANAEAGSISTIGDFDPVVLDKVDFGTSPAAKGRYILDAFYKDRQAASGVAGLNAETSKNRPGTITTLAGRILYAGLEPGVIYVSPTLNSITDAGNCYQSADPTSETISDIIDTDGFVLKITECGSILKIMQIGSGVLVFATNGIWQVSGLSQTIFSATSHRADKLSKIAALSKIAIIEVEGSPIFATEGGIYTLAGNSQTGQIELKNLSLDTIQTHFNSISTEAKKNSKFAYNIFDKQLFWLVNTDPLYSGNTDRFIYNQLIIYDVTLKIFYKFSISDASTHPRIVGMFFPLSYQSSLANETIVDGLGNEIVDNADADVTVPFTYHLPAVAQVNLLCVYGSSYSVAKFYNTSFVDWEDYSEDNSIDAINYSSFLETGYIIPNDFIRNKNITKLAACFNRTETAFVQGALADEVAFNLPSSCLAQVKWNFADAAVAGKWSDPQQIYRFRRPWIYGDAGDPFNNGLPEVITETKFRGSGRAFSIKFYSEEGKDFQLVGWAAVLSGENAP